MLIECDNKNSGTIIHNRIHFHEFTTSKYKEGALRFDFGILVGRYTDNANLVCLKLDIIQVKKHDSPNDNKTTLISRNEYKFSNEICD